VPVVRVVLVGLLLFDEVPVELVPVPVRVELVPPVVRVELVPPVWFELFELLYELSLLLELGCLFMAFTSFAHIICLEIGNIQSDKGIYWNDFTASGISKQNAGYAAGRISEFY